MSCGLSVTRREISQLLGTSSLVVFEDDLLVDVSRVVLFDDFFAELIQGSHNLLSNRGRVETFRLSFLWVAVDTLVVSKQLWEGLWLSVCLGPCEFAWVKDFYLWSFWILWCWIFASLTIFVFTILLNFFFLLFLFEFFHLFLLYLSRLNFELH